MSHLFLQSSLLALVLLLRLVDGVFTLRLLSDVLVLRSPLVLSLVLAIRVLPLIFLLLRASQDNYLAHLISDIQ